MKVRKKSFPVEFLRFTLQIFVYNTATVDQMCEPGGFILKPSRTRGTRE
jgi:hypothetical protein